MLAPVDTIASTMLLRIRSTKSFCQTGRNKRAGEAQNHAAVRVAQHHLVDGGGAGGIARGISHRGHGVDQGNDVVSSDINVLNGRSEQFFLVGIVTS